MQVLNRVTFISEDDIAVVCQKCYYDLTDKLGNPYLDHYNWISNSSGQVSCKAKKYLICPNCGKEVILETWTESF